MKRLFTIIAVLLTVAGTANAQSALQKLKQKAEQAVNSAVGAVGEKLVNSEKTDEEGNQTKGSTLRTGLGSILQEASKSAEESSAASQAADAADPSIIPNVYPGGLDSLAAVKAGSIKKAGAIFATVPKNTPSYPATTDEQMASYLRALDKAELDLYVSVNDLMRRTGQLNVDTDKMQREMEAQREEEQKIRQRQQESMGDLNQAMEIQMKTMSLILTDAEMKQLQQGKFTPTDADIEKRVAGILNMSVAEYRGMEQKAKGMTMEEQEKYYSQIRANATPKGKEFLDLTRKLSKMVPQAGEGGLSEYTQIKMRIMEIQSENLSAAFGGGNFDLSALMGGMSSEDEYVQDEDGHTYTKLQWEVIQKANPKYIAYYKALKEWNFTDITRQRDDTNIGVDLENYIYRAADKPDLSKKKAVEEAYRAIAPAITSVFSTYGAAAAKKITAADDAFKKANGDTNSELVDLLNKALNHKDCTEADRIGWQTQLYMIEIAPLNALQKAIEARREYVEAMLCYPEYQDQIQLTGIKYNDFNLVYSKTVDYASEANFLWSTTYTERYGWGFERGVDRESPVIGKSLSEMLAAVKPCHVTYKGSDGKPYTVIFGDGYQVVGKTVYDAKNNIKYVGNDSERFTKTIYGTSGVENEFTNMCLEKLIHYYGYFSNGPFHNDYLAGRIHYVGKAAEKPVTVLGRSCKVYTFGMDEYVVAKEILSGYVSRIYVDSQTGAVLKIEEVSADSKSVSLEATAITNGAPALTPALIRKQLGITSPDNALWANGCAVERSYDVAWDAAGWKTMMGVQGWSETIPEYTGTGYLAEAILRYNFDAASFEVHGTDEADARAYAAKLEAAGFKGGEWKKSKGIMGWSATFEGGDSHVMHATIEMSKDGRSFIVNFTFDGNRKPWINYV